MFQNYCPKLVRFTSRAGGDGEARDIAETSHGCPLAPVHRYMVHNCKNTIVLTPHWLETSVLGLCREQRLEYWGSKLSWTFCTNW